MEKLGQFTLKIFISESGPSYRRTLALSLFIWMKMPEQTKEGISFLGPEPLDYLGCICTLSGPFLFDLPYVILVFCFIFILSKHHLRDPT
ncbi:MAG: hypothetical protein DRG83_19455 [Deltaproteobacteria bacterium]|nr:MAG: hypothetical protein DRG83_19455 [Deltaproteobacteria bacterium]